MKLKKFKKMQGRKKAFIYFINVKAFTRQGLNIKNKLKMHFVTLIFIPNVL